MLARRVLLGCVVSLTVGLPIAQAGKGDDEGVGPTKGRKLDTESPVAKALDELLRIDPRYAEDGTVELIYDFKDEEQSEDWMLEGLDRAEEANARGGRGRAIRSGARGPQALSLGAGSGLGSFVHRLEMKGDYEAVFRCHVERTTTRSDLVFLTGKVGASWGSQLVLRGSRGFSPAPGSDRAAPDKEPWNGGRVVTVTVASKGGEVTVSVNGARVDATKKVDADKLEGRVGIALSDMHLIVHRVTIRGTVDPTKL